MKKVLAGSLILLLLLYAGTVTVSAGPVLDGILKSGKLKVGTVAGQPPMNMKDKKGKIIGLEAELAELIAANMGVKVEFSVIPFADLLPALSAGKVDMVISSMSMTPERNLRVAFVGPYYISGKGILTKYENLAELRDPNDLNNPNFKMAVLKGSTSQMFAERAAPKAKLLTTKDYDEAVSLLIEGNIDAVIADYPFCAFSAFRHQSKGVIAGRAPLTFEPLGIAVREDTLLINWMQNFLGVLEGTGQMQVISMRWLQGGKWIEDLPE
jgi:polar amino acid transport system substrate-binding protein